jgi:HK97 family phage major capsid protein
MEPTQNVDVAAIAREAADAAVKAYQAQLAAEPPTTLAGLTAILPAEPRDPNDHGPFKSFGEQLLAVKAAGTPGTSRDERLYAIKATGLNEGVSSDGGFLVQQDFSSELLKRTYAMGEIASRVRKMQISANANGMKINAIDETSRANGSRWGGVQVYWEAEAAQTTASKPKFRQMVLDLKKLMGLCYATDELQADATALESVIMQAFPEEFVYKVEDGVIRGTGAGQMHGILGSGALVSVTKETGQAADTVVYANVRKMWSRLWRPSRRNAVWFVNQDVEEQLETMSVPIGTGGVPVFLPPGGVSTNQYSTLYGRPVIAIEQADTVGDQGDIMLLDLSQYLVAEKGGLQTASSIHVMFLYGENTFRFTYRVDGQPLWNTYLTPANSSNTLAPFITLDARA